MRTCVAQRGITGAILRARLTRGGSQPRAPALLLRHQGARSLIEVLRSDTEARIGALDQPARGREDGRRRRRRVRRWRRGDPRERPRLLRPDLRAVLDGRPLENPENRAPSWRRSTRGPRRHVAERIRPPQGELEGSALASASSAERTCCDLHVRAPARRRARCSALNGIATATTPQPLELERGILRFGADGRATGPTLSAGSVVLFETGVAALLRLVRGVQCRRGPGGLLLVPGALVLRRGGQVHRHRLWSGGQRETRASRRRSSAGSRAAWASAAC